jgi:hypothetical protein
MPRLLPSVAMMMSHTDASAALPAKQYPDTTATVGTTPDSSAASRNVGMSSWATA